MHVKLFFKIKIQASYYDQSFHLPSASELIDLSTEVNTNDQHYPVVKVRDWKLNYILSSQAYLS